MYCLTALIMRLIILQSCDAVLVCAALQVCVEVLVEYPFFVFGQGWSSCCPDRTTQLFELSCAKLCVGDVCVSLTLRSLRNGTLTNSQPAATAAKLKAGHLADSSPARTGATLSELGRVGGAGQPPPPPGLYPGRATPAVSKAERQDSATQPPPAGEVQCGGEQERPAARKRRWSAPERDQTERAEEEPPVTLPKPSFIPQEVKISIEGHSNAGSERCLIK